ncbi:MAG: helix-turn-helix transcriptional regulator [Muribaculaceae bacterium]|nr:helix-turn-helix transcriptional regulator [Muribaculaceae bacterium]
MDVLRKELEEIYYSQNLEEEDLPGKILTESRSIAEILASEGKGSTVITDASSDTCYIYGGDFGIVIGFFSQKNDCKEESSSDEDIIYARIHPEDLVDKRLLEFEFFKFVDKLSPKDKLSYKATCRLRMKDASGKYIYVENTTRLLRLSPAGKIWVILCSYDLSPRQDVEKGIFPKIINTASGEVTGLLLSGRRKKILTEREKEILLLIQEGFPSKIIADKLKISVHTVNRHRQNIISKLSVGNSIEAIAAAKVMDLF